WNTTAVAPGTYTLTAVATDNGGATGTSAGIPITLQAGAAQGLPAPWQTQDVGTVGLAGSATVAAGTYTLKGSGAGISGSSDAFLFAYQSLPGDGQIIARVTGIQSTQDFAKVGVMIREGLTPGARNASLMLTPSGLLYFQYRTWSSGTTQSVIASAHTPTWVKLTRTGSTLTAAYSTDGVTYTGLGAQGFTFGGPLVIGLAVSS